MLQNFIDRTDLNIANGIVQVEVFQFRCRGPHVLYHFSSRIGIFHWMTTALITRSQLWSIRSATLFSPSRSTVLARALRCETYLQVNRNACPCKQQLEGLVSSILRISVTFIIYLERRRSVEMATFWCKDCIGPMVVHQVNVCKETTVPMFRPGRTSVTKLALHRFPGMNFQCLFWTSHSATPLTLRNFCFWCVRMVVIPLLEQGGGQQEIFL